MVCFGVFVYTVFFFFFKQKTAYEMRISDWSSDVCSSDLDGRRSRGTAPRGGDRSRPCAHTRDLRAAADPRRTKREAHREAHHARGGLTCPGPETTWPPARPANCATASTSILVRSEEHTSELQSLMRISYAVFSFKKKKP